MSTLAGIDQALWDIKGRHHGVPVHELLGRHVRDRILVHQWLGSGNPAVIAESGRQDYEHGYRAFKLTNPGKFRPLETAAAIDRTVEQVAALRDAVGVDFHGRVSKPMVLELFRQLKPYNPHVRRSAAVAGAP